MKFLADEGVDSVIVETLRAADVDITYIFEIMPSAIDEDVLKMANEENRILITRDKDFGELVYRLRQIHSGIVLNRLSELSSETKAKIVRQVIEMYQDELYGSFTVIQPGAVRIRKLKTE